MTVGDTVSSWDPLPERIFARNPGVEISIRSGVPEWAVNGQRSSKSGRIDRYNLRLRESCRERGCHFVENAADIEDHANSMASVYSMDQSIHISYHGTAVRMEALRAYAKLQQLQGEII